jgi:putative ABC transport system permease protein
VDFRALVRERLQGATSGDPLLDADIVEELADDLAARYEAARPGRTDGEALAIVLTAFGDVRALARAFGDRRASRRRAAVPPAERESKGAAMFAGLGADLRYAARLLARTPAFTAAALLLLGVGVGGTTAIFGIVDTVLLRPLPYPEPDRLVAVWETDRDSGTVREPASVPDLLDFRQQSQRLDALVGVIATEFNLSPARSEPIRVAGLLVTDGLLPALGIHPVEGRAFAEEEYRTAAGQVLVSERLAGRMFPAGGAVGATLTLDDTVRTIVGVVPQGADVGVIQWLQAADYARGFADRDARSRVDVWAPLVLDPVALPRQTHPLLVLGRLAPGATVALAQEDLAGLAARLEHAHPANKARGVHLEPFERVVLGSAQPVLWALLLGVGVLFAGTCVNVANLVLVRGTGRLREVAVRTALGASPLRVARQFALEHALLAGAAAALSVVVAYLLLHLFVRLAPVDVPRLESAGLDHRVLGVTLGVAVLMACVFGLLPVLQAWRVDLQRVLAADGGRSGTGGPGLGRTRAALVVAEVSLAVVLTLGAALMIRTVVRLQGVDPGFQATGVAKAEFQLPESRYPADFRRWPNFAEMHRFNAALLTELEKVPGVQAAAIAGNHPLDPGFGNSFVVVGREAEATDWPEIAVRRVSPDYFRTLGVPLVRGRLLERSDDLEAQPVLLVNEAAAARFFVTQDPVGQQIAFWGMARRVVGIVGNERLHGPAAPAPPAVYVPLAQNPSANGAEVALVRGHNPDALLEPVRSAIARVDPGLAVFGVEPLSVTLAESTASRRFLMQLLAAFAAIALLLAAVGIHAALSYDVARRTREIGIRLALGAQPGRVVGQMVRRALALAAAGVVIGGIASLPLSRLLRSLLFGVAPGDATTLGAVAVLFAALALGASYLPARRAVRTDPLVALRED